MTNAAEKLCSLKKRSQFITLTKKGRKIFMPAAILQACRVDGGDGIRFGLTVSKKNGSAVKRNRIRRRLRILAKELLPRYGQGGYDYVFVARREGLTRPYQLMRNDIERALKKLKRQNGRKHGR